MHSSSGYFYSHGDVEQCIAKHHQNKLHYIWTEKKSTFGVIKRIICYPVAQVGYLIDLLKKIILLIGNLLKLLIVLPQISDNMKWERGVILLDNLLAVAICIVGILIPPLAYRLDHEAENKMIAWSNKVILNNQIEIY